MTRGSLAGALIAGTWLFAPLSAMSANINFLDLTDIVDVQASQFDVSGPVITHMNIFNGEDDVRVTGSFFSNSAAGLTGGNVAYQFEPGTSDGNTAVVSDIIQSSWNTVADTIDGFPSIANVTIDFGSDPASGPASCSEPLPPCFRAPLAQGIFENGLLQSLNELLDLPANITIFAQSDVDVPEPASLSLLGMGLLGFAWCRRKLSR